MKIPENTEQALELGKEIKDNHKAIEVMKMYKNIYQQRYDKLMMEIRNKENEAMRVATKCQLCRECIETAEGG